MLCEGDCAGVDVWLMNADWVNDWISDGLIEEWIVWLKVAKLLDVDKLVADTRLLNVAESDDNEEYVGYTDPVGEPIFVVVSEIMLVKVKPGEEDEITE
jgi:hypothetical protein